jgi:hypothetical protein
VNVIEVDPQVAHWALVALERMLDVRQLEPARTTSVGGNDTRCVWLLPSA